MNSVSTLLSILIIVSGAQCVLVPKQGPYTMVIKYAEPCEPLPSHVAFMKWKMNRVNRTTLLVSGNFSTAIEINNDVKVKSEFAVMTHQGWKHNYFNIDFNGEGMCSIFKTYGPEKFRAAIAAFKPPVAGCPIPPGNYTAKEISIDFKALTGVPVFMYNKYKITYSMHHPNLDGPEVFCVHVYSDFVPRRPSKEQHRGT